MDNSKGIKKEIIKQSSVDAIRNYWKGRKRPPITEKHRKSLSEAHKGQVAWNKGLKGFLAGTKHPWMAKGKDHYNWKGGISTYGYPKEWKTRFLDSIRERDNFICQECGIHQDELDFGQVKKLDVHHIDYNKENCDPRNLISLCRSCHVKTNVNREYWINYFNNKNYE